MIQLSSSFCSCLVQVGLVRNLYIAGSSLVLIKLWFFLLFNKVGILRLQLDEPVDSKHENCYTWMNIVHARSKET